MILGVTVDADIPHMICQARRNRRNQGARTQTPRDVFVETKRQTGLRGHKKLLGVPGIATWSKNTTNGAPGLTIRSKKLSSFGPTI